MKKILIATAAILAATGCAKHANEIPAQYVSPMQYQGYNCQQIGMEMESLSRRVSEIGGQVDKTASNDSAQMGIGLVLFWPVLFALDGDTPQAQEYGRLKGEFDALEKAAIQKKCSIDVEQIRPKAPKPQEHQSNVPPSRRR